jgi:glycoprotein-N-acetylgalactosamine 3-beta-galactosyltransferase
MKITLRIRVYLTFIGGFFGGLIIGIFFGKSKDESVSFPSSNLKPYDDSLSLMLEKEVKVLCWVFTHPANHQVRSIHLKNTWGKRCNKLLFMSSAADPLLPEIVVIPTQDGRVHLWKKTQLVYQYMSRLSNVWSE